MYFVLGGGFGGGVNLLLSEITFVDNTAGPIEESASSFFLPGWAI